MTEQAQLPEAELLRRCLAGDGDAWDELFDRHFGPATRFVYQLGYDFSEEDVEEICQEVFLTVIKNLHTFQGQSQFQTWLFRIAVNRARDFRQRQHAVKRGGGQRPLPLHPVNDEDLPIDPPSPLPTPAELLQNAEAASVVGRALERLGGPCQEIIELRYFADLSYEEISASLQLNAKTVSSRLSKCLDKLEKVVRHLWARPEPMTPPAAPGATPDPRAPGIPREKEPSTSV